MKKIFSLLAAALLIAACTPNEEVGTPFQAGQKVTLAASMDNNGANHLPGKQRVAGQDNGAQIDLTWNEGDQITVKVGDATAVFTLESGAGFAQGTFVGEMPAVGTTYQVNYPVNYNESVLANQTYVANGFDNGLMKMSTKVDGTVDGGFSLSADNALLGLQLTGTESLSAIVLTNTATGENYALHCADVTLSSTATLFYLVVPAGIWANGFVIEIYDGESNAITSFTKAIEVTFLASEAMIMPVKEVAKSVVPEYVDLGLSVKWATCNVGATTPEEYGDYFAWGEIKHKYTYEWTTYKWCYGSGSSITKYGVDGRTVLDKEDDVAAVILGGAWRMPTESELNELKTQCIWTWTTQNGVWGYKVSSKTNSNSIFLPAAGYYKSSTLYSNTSYYWSRSINTITPELAYSLGFFSNNSVFESGMSRFLGCPIRSVCP